MQCCGLQPATLLCPWDSPGKNTGVGCHFLLQGILDPGIKPRAPALQVDSLPPQPPEKPALLPLGGSNCSVYGKTPGDGDSGEVALEMVLWWWWCLSEIPAGASLTASFFWSPWQGIHFCLVGRDSFQNESFLRSHCLSAWFWNLLVSSWPLLKQKGKSISQAAALAADTNWNKIAQHCSINATM